MKFLLLCVLVVIASSIGLRAHQEQEQQVPIIQPPQVILGGFTGRYARGEGDLNQQESKMVEFIHKHIPEIVNYRLIYTEKQVVAGMNYCFYYESQTSKHHILKMCVWSKAWENNFLRLTTQDGRVFTQGGLDIIQPQNQPV